MHRSHLHVQTCAMRPSGFQIPFRHVPPQTQSTGLGAGAGSGVPSTMLDLAAATAAAARACSSVNDCGTAAAATSHAMSHS